MKIRSIFRRFNALNAERGLPLISLREAVRMYFLEAEMPEWEFDEMANCYYGEHQQHAAERSYYSGTVQY